jgi:hypothetical protein
MNKTSIELDFLLDQIDYTSVADPDPGSGAFLPPGSGIRDGAMVGSGIRCFLPPGSGMEQWSDPDPG